MTHPYSKILDYGKREGYASLLRCKIKKSFIAQALGYCGMTSMLCVLGGVCTFPGYENSNLLILNLHRYWYCFEKFRSSQVYLNP